MSRAATTRHALDPARFRAALERRMAEYGLDQYALADAVGVTQPTVSGWLGGRSPAPANLHRLLDALDLEFDTIARIAPNPADVVFVPRLGHVGAGAQPYADASDTGDVILADAYPANELRRLTGCDPTLLRSTVVVGDSMADELRPNDTVIYRPVSTFEDVGIYVFLEDHIQLVKDVQRLGGGALAIIPRNPRYEREHFLPVDDADTPNTYRSERTGRTATLTPIGRVVLYLKAA